MVRILLDLHPDPAGGVEGAVVRADGGQPQRFHGWLELLRVLEAVISPPADDEPP